MFKCPIKVMTRNLELQFFVLSLFIVKDDFEFYTFLIETFWKLWLNFVYIYYIAQFFLVLLERFSHCHIFLQIFS